MNDLKVTPTQRKQILDNALKKERLSQVSNPGPIRQYAQGLAKEEQLQRQLEKLDINNPSRRHIEQELYEVEQQNAQLVARNRELQNLTPAEKQRLLADYRRGEIESQLTNGSGLLNELAQGLAMEDDLLRQLENMPADHPDREQLLHKLKVLQAENV